MSTPRHHFNAYYHDNVLLIQFVIAEFVATYQLSCEIKALNCEDLQNLNTRHASLAGFLSQLLGTTAHHNRHAVSHWTRGSLTKLKDYCEQFLHNSEQRHRQASTLYLYVHRAWLSALKCLELTRTFPIGQEVKASSSTFSALKRALKQLDARLASVVKQIPRVVASYREDRRVLFFLLRRKAQLVEVYGEDFLIGWFKLPFEKEEEMREMVAQHYKGKGLDCLPCL